MTIDTPAHGQRLSLLDPLHLLNSAVASRTIDTCRCVDAMIEVHVIRQLVNTAPSDGLIGSVRGPDRQQSHAVRANFAVALHADLGRGKRRKRAPFHREMAEPAVETEISCVQLVTELDRLEWRVADLPIGAICVVSQCTTREESYGN